jgi:hypothetical protein
VVRYGVVRCGVVWCVVRCVVCCVVGGGACTVWCGAVCVGVAWSSVWCVVCATRLQLDTARKLPWHHPARLH